MTPCIIDPRVYAAWQEACAKWRQEPTHRNQMAMVEAGRKVDEQLAERRERKEGERVRRA